jgi:hypothetical protein
MHMSMKFDCIFGKSQVVLISLILALLCVVQCFAQESEPDHSMVPGVIIDYSSAKSRQYIGSPGLAVLPDGCYVASHDFFGPGTTNSKTRIHRSTDKGKKWEILTDIEGQWWSSLFVHEKTLYIMGVSKQHGDTVIRRSIDGGRTWTTPTNANTGLLLGGAKYHCAPVPVVVHDNRIWRAMEDAMGPGGWGSHFRAFMMSAPVDADLLKADNWTCTNRVGRDPNWLEGKFGGWLEGNAVVTPDGRIVDILRVECKPEGGKAAMIEISEDGKTATFDPKTGFIDLPGGCKKFTIRFDPRTELYWSLSNYIPEKYDTGNPGATRNTLALISSADLRNWAVKSIILQHPDTKKHGFQYVDWLFEDNDIIAVSRTAYDDGVGGAHNYHDANYLTFHRIKDFRDKTLDDAPLK